MTEPQAPRARRPTAAIVGLALALVAIAVMAFSFVNGIAQALDDSSDGAGGYVALFLLGLAIDLVTLVAAIVRLIAGRWRVLSIATIVVAAVPIAVMVYLYASN